MPSGANPPDAYASGVRAEGFTPRPSGAAASAKALGGAAAPEGARAAHRPGGCFITSPKLAVIGATATRAGSPTTQPLTPSG